MFKTGFARCPIDGSPLQALTGDPLEGTTFADRYVIEQCIGEGGMGRVYRARHQRMSRQFAIKVLYGDHATDPKMRDRFAREAEAASRLEHPNVISVIDFGETADGLLYLAMNFVEGKELDEIIRAEAPLEATRVEAMVRQLCSGLAHAHSEGLIHRDFKGSNVIVTERDGRELPRIVDFGLAMLSEVEDEDRITTDGLVFGTPMYMSPEQLTAGEVTHLTDLFALGIVVYEMLAGVGPFDGAPLALGRQNLLVKPPPIGERVAGLEVDARLEAIAQRLMAKKPADRFQSADEVIAALDTCSDKSIVVDGDISADDAGGAIKPPAVVTRPEDRGFTSEVGLDALEPRRPRVALWLLALLVFALGAGIVWIASTRKSDAADGVAAVSDADASIERESDATGPGKAIVAVVVDAGAASGESDTAVIDASAARGGAGAKAGTTTETRTDSKTGTRPDVTSRSEAKAAADDATSEGKKASTETSEKPAVAEISRKRLSEIYAQVNRQIRAFESESSAAAAAPLWESFRQIVLNDALSKPQLRGEALKRLRAIERRIKAARAGNK